MLPAHALTRRTTYGVDAPGVMLSLLASGTLVAGTGLLLLLASPWAWLAVAAGAIPCLFGTAMAAYALAGKLRMRDDMLAAIPWTGTEQVLDIGTGAGLLLIGAAKRLTTGHATGIDIWAAKDLSGNTQARTEANIAAEGVAGRASVQTADATALPFADATFDVVLSLLCIHNVSAPDAACREIARVCKPGGRVILADYVPTAGYGRALAAAGLQVTPSRTRFRTALGLMWELRAAKP